MQNPTAQRLFDASFNILVGLCVLLPLAFLPINLGGFAAIKYTILYIGVLCALTAWVISQVLEGTISFPKNKVLLGLSIFATLSLISSLLSPVKNLSLWGDVFNLDSFATLITLVIVTFLTANFTKDQKKLVKLFLAIFFTSIGIIFLQLILFFLKGSPFVANFFPHISSQSTLIGTWIDFSFFVIFTFILGLLMTEVLSPKGLFRVLSIGSVVVSLLALCIVNFKAAWIFTAVASLLVFVYKSSVERAIMSKMNPEYVGTPSKFPILAFISLIFTLTFILGGSTIGGVVSRWVGLNYSDVRPNFSSTMDIVGPVISKDPVFGYGPTRFAEAWEQYKDIKINDTAFWNTPFEAGHSTISTLFTTNGIAPTIFLIASLVLSLVLGFKLFNAQYQDKFTRFIAVTSLIVLILFSGLLFVWVPSIVVMVLGFIIAGLLLGVSVLVGKADVFSFNYLKNPRSSFFIILLLVLVCVVTLSSIFFATTKFASTIGYNRAVRANNLDEATTKLVGSLNLSQNDIYWRTLSSIYVSKFRDLSSQDKPDNDALQTLFSQAQASAQRALDINPTNPVNMQNLAQVYQLIAGANTQNGAYELANDLLTKAVAVSPKNPSYEISFALLFLSQGDRIAASEHIEKALSLKPDFLDAYIVKAQIKQISSDSVGAKDILKDYVNKYPNNDNGFYAYGTSLLALKEYGSARDAFNKARNLNPQNINAHIQYISVLKTLGQKEEAIKALEILKQIFPNISGVESEIENIKNLTPTTEANIKDL